MTNDINGNWTAMKSESLKMLMLISNVFYIQTHKSLFISAILCFYNICYITVLGSNAFDESGFHLERRIISRMVITTFRT